MKWIKLIRTDLEEGYDPIYYTDRYLLTKEEANSIDINYIDIIDFGTPYGEFLERSYGKHPR